MKRIFFYLSALLLLMVSCDKNGEDDNPPIKENGKVKIKLNAGLSGLQLRSSVDAISDMSPIGIFSAVTGDWTATPLINNDQSTVGSGGGISFTGTYYYPVDGSIADFYTYHPYAPIDTSGANYVTAPSLGVAPVLHFTITGQEDIMFAYHEYGSNTILPASFTFLHKLTQLKFSSIGTSFPSGVTIQSITITDTNTKSTMDISTGVVGTWDTPSSVSVPILNGGAITSTATAIGAPVMLEPDNGSFTVDIVTSAKTYSGISITPIGDTSFLDGKSYTIMLTFTATGIALDAVLTPWDTGTGAGAVQ